MSKSRKKRMKTATLREFLKFVRTLNPSSFLLLLLLRCEVRSPDTHHSLYRSESNPELQLHLRTCCRDSIVE
jgi:hypothetical protein